MLEGDAIVRTTIPELLSYYSAFEVKPGLGKLKRPLDSLPRSKTLVSTLEATPASEPSEISISASTDNSAAGNMKLSISSPRAYACVLV